MKQADDLDAGTRPGVSSDDRRRLVELERENRELRRANAILKTASAFFRGGARRPIATLVRFIDEHRHDMIDSRQFRGSSRSAGCCLRAAARSPRAPTMRPRAAQPVTGWSAMRSWWPRFGGCMQTITGCMGPQGVASAAPGGHPGSPLHRGTADDGRRAAPGDPGRQDQNHEAGCCGASPRGFGGAAVQRAAACSPG